MYNHLRQNLAELPELSVQVIDGSSLGHEWALHIKSSKAEMISYLDLNEEGYIKTLHEIWR